MAGPQICATVFEIYVEKIKADVARGAQDSFEGTLRVAIRRVFVCFSRVARCCRPSCESANVLGFLLNFDDYSEHRH